MTTNDRGDARVRVLTLIDKPIAIGGAERLAAKLTLSLDPRRFVRYFCATRESPFRLLDDELREGGVSYISLGRRSRLDLLAWFRFVRLLRRERIDVIHAHLFGSNFWGSLLGRASGVPVIVAHEHTWSYVGRPVRKLLDRHVVARLADTVIAVSEADREKMRTVEGIPDEKVTVIPNGIEDPHVSAPPHETRASLGLDDQSFVLVAVAVIRPQKRLDRLIEAAALLRERLPAVCVLIVGDGYEDERRRLIDLISELRLEETVRMLGERADAADFMAAADAGVISSDYEGIPLSMLEFMALGKPVISTAVGGVPEVIRDGETGVLVHELTASALADAVVALAERPPHERRALGEAARALQQSRYSFAAYAATVADLYTDLLARKPR